MDKKAVMTRQACVLRAQRGLGACKVAQHACYLVQENAQVHADQDRTAYLDSVLTWCLLSVSVGIGKYAVGIC